MKQERFEKLTEAICDRVKSTLAKKKAEYNLTDDRLDVFKKAARRQMITPQQALLGYMDKHIGSIYDYIHEDSDISPELLSEKVIDAIDYLILLYALYDDELFSKQDMRNTKEEE